MTKLKKTVIFFMVVCFFTMMGFGLQVKAVEKGYDVIGNAVVVKSSDGVWKDLKKGRAFKKNDGKYIKNGWYKIDSKVYSFDSGGYLETGWKTYKSYKYYLDTNESNKGVLLTGWQDIKDTDGKTYRYYLSKSTGSMQVGLQLVAKRYYYFNTKGQRQYGWQTIGSSKYYFDQTGEYTGFKGVMVVREWIDGKYLNSDGIMVTNKTIAGIKVGADGLPVNKLTSLPKVKCIFLGDSRTVGMMSSIGGQVYHDYGHVYYCKDNMFIAKGRESYAWFSTTGVSQLRKELDRNPNVSVVLNWGVNDFSVTNDINKIADNYLKLYKSLIGTYKPKGTRFYVMSVNPVAKEGHNVITNTKIQSLNNLLYAGSKAGTYQYLDIYTELMQDSTFTTSDGLHYSKNIYNKIYNSVRNKVS